MYLLGIYLAFTGLVSARLRDRARQAMRSARELVDSLEQKKQALELQSHELEEASHKAEQANVAKAQFLATISHEIRTPMNGVLGTTELLLATPLEARQRRLAETAHRSATALLALIDDVLDLSRIEASKLTLQSTSFDLRALVTDAGRPDGDDRARQAADADVHDLAGLARVGRRRSDAPAPGARQPAAQRGQVHRARRHRARRDRPRRRRRRRARCCSRCATPASACAEDQFDSVFDAFTQVDASSTRRHGGTGLGLAIVKEIAELMGGQVGVDSRLEEGSTFWFEVSLKKGSRPEVDVAPAAAIATACRRASCWPRTTR